MKTFDENNIQSITDFINEWGSYGNNDKDFFKFNFNKTLNELKKLKVDEYDQERAYLLVTAVSNLAFFFKSKNVEIETVTDEFYAVYIKIMDYYLESNRLLSDSCIYKYKTLSQLFHGLDILTNSYLHLSANTIKFDIHKKGLMILKKVDLLTKQKVDDSSAMELCYALSNFYKVNAEYKNDTKEALLKIGLLDFLLNQLTKLNNLLNYKPELKYIKTVMTQAVVYLLAENEMDKLPIIDDIVQTQVDMLRATHMVTDKNKPLYNNSKHYTSTKFAALTVYNQATCCFRILKILSLNDDLKQKLFEAKIFESLDVFLISGNDEEKDKTCELLASLCFNRNVLNHLKQNKKYLKCIQNIQNITGDTDTKRYCEQIIEMVSRTEREIVKLITTNGVLTNGYIMISYDQKYKDKCIEINEELKKKGFETWLDIENAFVDLQDTMARTIQNASIVLICYSNEYEFNITCRYEAEYAALLKKKIIGVKLDEKCNPEGWLQHILATKSCLDFSKKNNERLAMHNNLTKLINTALNCK